MNRTPQHSRPARTRPNPRHAAARRQLAFRPFLESIERRQLLAGGFLQGTVFVDTDASGKLEPGNTPLAGALVQLVDPISHNVLQSVTTQADGNYLFTGLAPGNYQLVETPPSGYANDAIQNNSPLTPVLSSTASTINVQVFDPSQLTVSFSSGDEYARKPGAVLLQASPDGGVTYVPEAFSIGQLPITVSGPGGLVTSEFSSYCVDVFAGLSFSPDSFGATGLPAPPALNGGGNAGRIGYLYDQFGSVLSQVAESDAQALQQQALQLAIWKLEYDSVPNNFTASDFNSGNIKDISLINAGGITNYSLTSLLDAAASFIDASLGQSQPVTLLQVIPGSQSPAGAGYQDLLAPGSLNFGNTVKGTPAINTRASETAAGVVGLAQLSDSATLSGGYNPTGTITFTLTAPDGTVLPEGSVTVTGDGAYPSPSVLAAEVGTYTWHAVYSGDSLNNGAADSGANEGVTTVKAAPAINTQASETAGGVVGASVLSDTATLSGGFNPTGTIAFSLTAPDGTTAPEGSVTVTGDAAYASPTAVTATEVGTYTWHAVYSGDANNAGATDGGANEGVVTAKAGPAISTQASETAGGVVGVAKLSDSAVVTGGFSPTGTIAFTLTAPDGTVLNEGTVPVTGDGTYASPSVAATQVGTYTWHASYSGDGLNNGAVDQGGAAEQVTTVKAGPAIATTPGGPVALGLTISGTKFLDLTGNGFSTDDTPQAGVTINLYLDTNGAAGLQVGSGGDTFVGSTTTGANGAYSFAVTAAGTYYVSESVPSSYIQTGGGPSGSAGNAYWTVVATGGHGYSGYNFDDYLIPACTSTGISYTVTTPSNHSTTVTSLSGNTAQGDTVTVTFTVPAGKNDQLTLVSYSAPGSSFSDATAHEQTIYQQATGNFGPGIHTLKVQIPNNDYQIDLVCGLAIDELEPNQNGKAYGPDSANILYHAEDRFISSDNGGTTAAALPTPPTPASAALITVTDTLSDSATLSGGISPTGTITFYLFAPGVTPNVADSNNVYSDTVTISGDGTYSTAVGTNPGGYMPTAAGAYQWVAVYNGDAHNNAVAGSFGSEPEAVSQAAPTITTQATASANCVVGVTQLSDTAVLGGGYNPTGTITFSLTAPDGTTMPEGSVTVTGNKSYTSPTVVATEIGTYTWHAVYSGDTNNVTAIDNGQNESVTTKGGSGLAANDTATIGFWHNRNGQALIDSFNGGSNSTALGNWLAQLMPNTFGANAGSANNLTGKTNSQVASYYSTLFGKSGLQKTYAQVLATALAVYATEPSLGGAQGASYGFNESATGTGGKSYNVGSAGAAIGVANGTTLTILQILKAQDAVDTSGLIPDLSDTNTIFNGINTGGDLS